MGLDSLDDEPGFLKAGFLGFASSGKTYTAAKLAIGIRKHFKLDGPIAILDTEAGTHGIREMIKKETGKSLLGKRTRSFDAALLFLQECQKEKVSVAIIDSITHLWEDLRDAHLRAANALLAKRGRNPKANLEFQDWGPIKRRWADWTALFLNSPMHIIVCGRAGHEYGHEENEQTGKKDLVKVGIKMKAESEFGFEPSLVVEMERGEKNEKRVRVATVIKDRFAVMDGKTAINPDFEFFLPHIVKLNPASHISVDIKSETRTELDDMGRDDYDRRKLDREILLEKIEAEMVKRWPGQTIEHKKLKIACLEKVFATNAWAQVKVMALDELKAGLSMLCNLDDKLEVVQEPAKEVPVAIS